MKENLNSVLFQKIINGADDGFAYCEILFDNECMPNDYRFLIINNALEILMNRDIDSTLGKTIKEVDPTVEKYWIDKIFSAVHANRPVNFTYFNTNVKKYYRVKIFMQGLYNFVMTFDDITKEIISIEELSFQNKEKEKWREELLILNKELKYQNTVKEKHELELVLVNKELEFINIEKKKHTAKLVVENKKLQSQNYENEKIRLELIAFKKKAKESAWLSSVFLSNMSHEVRAPMNGILGFSELLKSPGLSVEKQLDYIRIIERFGNSMLIELDFLTSLFNPNFMKFEEVINNNIYSNLSVNQLAIQCNMSLSSFKRKFAEIYNVSPIKYFMKIKLQKSVELLKDKKNLISNIATDVGFESLTTFNRSFKSYYGKSPSKFRLDEND